MLPEKIISRVFFLTILVCVNCSVLKAQKVYALLVGLEYIAKNVQDTLKLSPDATLGVPEDIYNMNLFLGRIKTDQTTIILNEKATKKEIVHSLEKSLQLLEENDALVIYFSCHGIPLIDKKYTGMPNDYEPDSLDEALVLYDDLISDDELQYIVAKNLRKGYLSVIVDACHSGTIMLSIPPNKTVEELPKQVHIKSSENAKIKFNTLTYYLPEEIGKRGISKNLTDTSFTTKDSIAFLDSLNFSDNFLENSDLKKKKILFFSATSDNKSAYGNIGGSIFTYYLTRLYLNLYSEWEEYGKFISYDDFIMLIKNGIVSTILQEPQFNASDFLIKNNYTSLNYPFKFK